MSTATASDLTLKLSRFIKAPPARVFAAWTQPENLMKWFGPGASHLVSAKTDLRVGGRYHLSMNTTGCGSEKKSGIADISGTYKEVKPHTRLAFTWAWSNNPQAGNDETLVTLDFMEVQGGTQLTLTHEGFADEEACGAHTHGWNGALDKLERQEEKTCHSLTPGNFSWNEMITTETDKASAFYTKLFGWETQAMPGMDYTIFKQGNNYVGGMIKCEMKEIPSHWLPYVTVVNADESVAAAVKLGAKAVVEPKDIPNVGRIAVLVDPNGAAFGMWQQQGM
jgi:uncharacterized protein YndB with AHSA1/START domain/predicted enzyme related to lactoylglutathione lyase